MDETTEPPYPHYIQGLADNELSVYKHRSRVVDTAQDVFIYIVMASVLIASWKYILS